MDGKRKAAHVPLQAWIAPAYDAFSWALAIVLASYLRYQVFSNLHIHIHAVLIGVAVSATFQLGVGFAFIYRHRWRIGSFEEMLTVSGVIAVVGLMLLVASLLFLRSGLSLGDDVGATLFTLVFAAFGRASYRVFSNPNRLRPQNRSTNRTIIFGAGDAGIQVVEALSRMSAPPFTPVAILDDNPAKLHLRIRNLRVIGNRRDIAAATTRLRATTLLIAIANVNSPSIMELLEIARSANLEVRILPPIAELLTGIVQVTDIRPIKIEDLLGRHEVVTDLKIIDGLLRDRRVLVTGAGGSIGSELCRQISTYAPASLVMLDRNESGLFGTQLAIEGRALLDSESLVLGDIRDRGALDEIFDRYRPEVVFHAAALKHLALLELWPTEALKTNVWGTANLLDVASKYQVRTFVNISTDKAANPTSVLGYSKRITERMTASYRDGDYLSVRFGNVLGSQGSFLHAFREQVRRGGPITVTDPNVTRYFMTVFEAVQLTLQAGAQGKGGDVLVLDMGEPVRILDVAQRLADDAPTPIEIVFTGLRPGEKLHEALFGDDEKGDNSIHPSISSCQVAPIHASLCRTLDADVSAENVKKALQELCLFESASAKGEIQG